MKWEDIALAVFSILLGVAVAEVRNYFARRTALIREVAERYIEIVRSPSFRDTPAERMFAMQISGVSSLKGRNQVNRFMEKVVHRGCTCPLIDGEWHPVITEKSLPGILFEASAHGHQLTSDADLYRFFVQRIFDAQKKKAHDTTKDTEPQSGIQKPRTEAQPNE